MPVTIGAHHLALFTHDMDRFIRFYEEIFDADTTFDLSEPGPGGGTLRHSLIDLGGGLPFIRSKCRNRRGMRVARWRWGREVT
ncbi:VOC family protein [Rhizobium sullae]|uniref:VOC family protein n=1 Tax=Rhizobium sullae TaxID=50338 RepID=UPI0024535A67|nr:VOC family protein [Rhizobium sullae]